ncbi:MAG: hypothetical protein IPJ37_16485 [Bacteroidales bacterium]|nr:hypothetical protein [Bacteroidales bacterium]
MKFIAIITFGITSLFINTTYGEEINFNPRLLHKELSTLLCGADFQMHELVLPDSVIRNNIVNGKFFTILCKQREKYLAYIGRVNSCRAGGCSNPALNNPGGEYEYFDYFILFDSERRVIL